ncbi:MAG: hypothetical protein ACREDK_02735 [Thermoplasmata archaeon]
MKDQEYYNLVAAGLAFGVVLVFLLTAVVGAAANSNSPPATPTGPAHMYLTVQINPDTGMPQYSPANFTVPVGTVTFTIVDYDSAVNWDGCTCNVSGTVGGTELVNGTSLATVSNANVAHTFTIPTLGLNVLSPGGGSIVTFTVVLTQSGSYVWICTDPCGSDGFSGAPMGTDGYMSGTMTVG